MRMMGGLVGTNTVLAKQGSGGDLNRRTPLGDALTDRRLTGQMIKGDEQQTARSRKRNGRASSTILDLGGL